MSLKAVFISSPCWDIAAPPYNIALLKAVCQQNNHEVLCKDFNIKFYHFLKQKKEEILFDKPTNWCNYEYVIEVTRKYQDFIEQCADELLETSAKVFGFSITDLSLFFAREIGYAIKRKDASRIVVFGGPSCFKQQRGVSLFDLAECMDGMCYQEGEKVLPQLLTLVDKGQDWGHLPGFVYRGKDGALIDGGDIDLVEDLSLLPYADFSDFDLNEYCRKELPISTSRGCINKCVFCSETNLWQKYRFRTAENIFSEMQHQLSLYPQIESFFFNDSLINGNVKMLDQLCQLLIDHNVNIHWGGQASIRAQMTTELLQKLKDTGLSHVSYGLESASTRLLKVIRKNFTQEIAEDVIRRTRAVGIKTDLNVIVGFPQETDEDVMETAQFLKRNREYIDQIHFHTLVVAPGSYIFEHRNEWGIVLNEKSDPYNNWTTIKEDNTFADRIKKIKFYQEFLGTEGESYFAAAEYYISIGTRHFENLEYEQALDYFQKAKKMNEDQIKDEWLNQKIQFIQENGVV